MSAPARPSLPHEWSSATDYVIARATRVDEKARCQKHHAMRSRPNALPICCTALTTHARRIRIERMKTVARIASREDDVDATVYEKLGGDVDRIVKVEDGIGGETTIDDARVVARAIRQKVIEARQDERERQIARAQTK